MFLASFWPFFYRLRRRKKFLVTLNVDKKNLAFTWWYFGGVNRKKFLANWLKFPKRVIEYKPSQGTSSFQKPKQTGIQRAGCHRQEDKQRSNYTYSGSKNVGDSENGILEAPGLLDHSKKISVFLNFLSLTNCNSSSKSNDFRLI